MKKLFFFAATAAIALSSCSSDDLAQAPVAGPEVNDGAVQFSAYSARNTRAAGDREDLTSIQTKGFGVFAYDQGATAWTTYNTSNSQPNFFYNQKVDWDGTNSVWKYEPVKYYNNNTGAKHSFFAYAPHKSDIKAVFALAKAPQIRYTMGTDNYDLLWGAQWGTTSNIDVVKPSVTSKIAFNFKHALSCITIKAVPFIDEVHGTSDPTLHPEHVAVGKLAEGTVVTLRSVKFVGTNLPSQGLLNLADGTWTVEGTDEGAFEMTTATVWDASTGEITPTREDIVTDKMVIPSTNTFNIQVVYDVTTTDTSNPKNNSTITNTITSTENFTLTAGTAYEFHLDLGLTSVKFDAKVVAWTVDQDVDVDLPNNKLETITSPTNYTVAPATNANFLGESATAPAPQASKLYYNTGDNTMYESDGSDWTAVTAATVFMNNSVIYDVAAGGACTPADAPRWITVGGTNYNMLVNGAYVAKGAADTTYSTEAEFFAAINAAGFTGGDKVYSVAGTIYYVHK